MNHSRHVGAHARLGTDVLVFSVLGDTHVILTEMRLPFLFV